MDNQEKKQRNKLQLKTIIFFLIGMVYVWQTYRATQLITPNRTSKIIFDVVVASVAFFVSWYNFREAKKINLEK